MSEGDEIQKEITEEDSSGDKYEPIKDIIECRKKQQENNKRRQELKTLKAEREELELQANIRREKLKIEQLKMELEQPEKIIKQVIPKSHYEPRPETIQLIKQVKPKSQNTTVPLLPKEEITMINGRPAKWCEEHNQMEWAD